MPGDRPPLLAWDVPTAEVVPFPCRSRIGKIRRTAQLIDESTDRAAKAHWSRTVDDLTRQMTRAGIPPERITDELRAFAGAVLAELRRRSRGQNTHMPDGGDAA